MPDTSNKAKQTPSAGAAPNTMPRHSVRAELVWEGKYDAGGRRAAPLRVVLPCEGRNHGDGQGVPQNFVEAHKWLSLAASERAVPLGPADRALGLNAEGLDRELRESILRTRDNISTVMTPGEITEAQRLAREWLEKHQQ
jgi:hypothetical protein